ncbi:hypothetical protein B0H10DRAFT_2242903 [Mycena sp. CBHHK59/15]|nr:hypothetical protein B0H10DRAFT_2242903 [Mycena sp. CBHHK59/15]
MLVGGSIMYLKPDEAWPVCATCVHPLVPLIQLNVSSAATPVELRELIPSVVPDGGSLATILQLFVCPEPECYDTSTLYSTDTRSWIVRVATVLSSLHQFLPARFVETWAAGKQETLHSELLWDQDDSEEFYAVHEPEPGLKLLGHAVRGKFLCAEEECPKPGNHDHLSWRELIQLGDRFHIQLDSEEDEAQCNMTALDIMSTIGNAWIEQCVEHPEVLLLSMSGNW